MSIIFSKQQDSYTLSKGNKCQQFDTLPVGTYTVEVNVEHGYFFTKIADFELPQKMYGNTHRHCERILNTFDARPNATGVLLNGEKGSGKTMLTKLISIRAREKNIPTVVINSAYYGEAFNQFIQSVDQPLIIIFDEFEKVFDADAQEQSLTLLDGVYPSKKLFLLTVNNKYSVSQHMRNRPGRIFYMIEYAGLDTEFIREYCIDNLKDQTHIETMCRLVMFFDSFNFDMLKAMVEEMNRYNENPHQVLEMLNAKPLTESTAIYDIRVLHEGEELRDEFVYPIAIRGNPLQAGELSISANLFGINVHDGIEYNADPDVVGTGKDNIILTLTPDQCKKIDSTDGSFTYVAKNNITVVFRRQPVKAFNYSHVF